MSMGVPAWASGVAFDRALGTENPPDEVAPGRSAWDRVCDGTLTDEERQRAADEVVEQTDLPLDKIAMELRFPLAGRSGAAYLVRAIERARQPSPALFGMIRARFDIADRDELPALLGAVGAFATREAAALAIEYMGEEGAIGQAAQAAAVRATGRDDLGSDRRAWVEWMASVRDLSDAQWTAELACRRGERLQRIIQHERAVVARLIESLRKAHIDAPEGERAALLATYIRDALPEIRDLGFSLINRELGAGATLNGEVSAAALDLLSHRDARTRASAALLVNQLSPAGAEPRVLEALERESEPVPAAAMLDAASRWASPSLSPLVLTWLKTTEEPPWRSTTNALWALARAGVLSDSQREEALGLVRRVRDTELTSSACRFLGAMGTDDDRVRLAGLLEGESPARRLAAASALASFPEHADAIVHAAALDEELFPIAARAILLHRPTVEGYRQLREVAPAEGGTRREGLLLVAHALTAADLFSIATNSIHKDERTDLLEDLTSEARLLSERSLPDNLVAMTQGAVELAHLRLEEGQAEPALVVLDRFADSATGETRGEVLEMQVAALLLLDRMELAEVLDAPVSAWLRGLRLSATRPHGGKIAEALEARFGGSLTPLERDELNALKQVIADQRASESSRARLDSTTIPPR